MTKNLLDAVNPELRAYVEREILPRYDAFDRAHQQDHVRRVIATAMQLAAQEEINPDWLYVAAAYHDVGLAGGRACHHILSAAAIVSDPFLQQRFTAEELRVMAEAAEDHRASAGRAPRSIYGRLVAEADREIVPEKIVLRTIQYSLEHFADLDREGHYLRTCTHLAEKYGEGGYLQLWIPHSENATRLAKLRRWMADEQTLRRLFDRLYDAETHSKTDK